eukprot:gene9175-biopygen159
MPGWAWSSTSLERSDPDLSKEVPGHAQTDCHAHRQASADEIAPPRIAGILGGPAAPARLKGSGEEGVPVRRGGQNALLGPGGPQ